VSVLDQVGSELGVSSWITVDQTRIDEFAECTGDHQWIHVDRERAAKGPYGATIAHGYLTLALVATTLNEIIGDRFGAREVLNYGIERLRFVCPVKVDSRVRNRAVLAGADPKGSGRTLFTIDCVMEIDGEGKPALVVTALVMAMGPE
jgi:acyl dehydratase